MLMEPCTQSDSHAEQLAKKSKSSATIRVMIRSDIGGTVNGGGGGGNKNNMSKSTHQSSNDGGAVIIYQSRNQPPKPYHATAATHE